MNEDIAAPMEDGPAVGLAAWLESASQLLPEHPLASASLALLAVCIAALLVHFVARHIVLRALWKLVKRSPTTWDDAIVEYGVLRRLVPIAPLLVFYIGAAHVPHLSAELKSFLQRLAMATIALVAVRSFSALLAAINSIYSRYPISRGRPIKGYLQVLKILAFLAAGIIVIAVLMDQSPWFFLSGLGAMTAVLLLIFRDTLLSFVAGVQLTGNDLIRVGDWIEMPQFDADGDVVDISLNVVKVQNWDRTISVIPAHKFLEHSFRNWRGMFDSGGRRIKRSIHIDMTTVRFLTAEEIARFRRFVALKNHVETKVRELEEYNRTHVHAEFADVLANGRHLTNVGTFRAYIAGYLRRHPKIHQEMIFLIRQLEPTPKGLPLEIYVFANDTRWVEYEGIQADIFDHLLAVLPEFGLRVYQEPAGSDLARLSDGLSVAGLSGGERKTLTLGRS